MLESSSLVAFVSTTDLDRARWRVDDVDRVVDVLASSGVTFNRYDGMDQDSAGVWTTPGGDRVAWFSDPDGNNLSLTQFA